MHRSLTHFVALTFKVSANFTGEHMHAVKPNNAQMHKTALHVYDVVYCFQRKTRGRVEETQPPPPTPQCEVKHAENAVQMPCFTIHIFWWSMLPLTPHRDSHQLITPPHPLINCWTHPPPPPDFFFFFFYI